METWSSRDWVGRIGTSILAIAIVATVWRIGHLYVKNLPISLPSGPIADLIAVKGTFDLPGAQWADSSLHLLLVTQSSCPFSKQSVGFFQSLEAATDRLHVPLVVVSPDPRSITESWLKENGIHADQVYSEVDLTAVGVAATPTLITVDSSSTILGISEGRLTVGEEADVMAHLSNPSGYGLDHAHNPRVVNEAEFSQRAIEERIQVVDIRSREDFGTRHRPIAINIPQDEFRQRAQAELDFSRLVAIDCRERFGPCRRAGRTLLGLGADVILVVSDDRLRR